MIYYEHHEKGKLKRKKKQNPKQITNKHWKNFKLFKIMVCVKDTLSLSFVMNFNHNQKKNEVLEKLSAVLLVISLHTLDVYLSAIYTGYTTNIHIKWHTHLWNNVWSSIYRLYYGWNGITWKIHSQCRLVWSITSKLMWWEFLIEKLLTGNYIHWKFHFHRFVTG